MIKKKISIKALEVDTRFFEGKLLKNENNVWGNSRCNCGSSFRETREQFATDLRLLYSPTLYLLVFFPQCPNLFFVFCFIQNSTAIHVKNVYEHAETRHKQLGTYVSPLGVENIVQNEERCLGKKQGEKSGTRPAFLKGCTVYRVGGFPLRVPMESNQGHYSMNLHASRVSVFFSKWRCSETGFTRSNNQTASRSRSIFCSFIYHF